MRTLVIALLAASPALADCEGEVIFACPVKSRVLELCLTEDAVSYSYGKPGRPDLFLTSAITRADYLPWDGFGRTIHDQVRFYNDGVSYEVWSSIDKQMSADEPEPEWQGGVIVTQGDEVLADLACTAPPDPPTLDALYQAKQDAGQCWDFDGQQWATCTQ
jgi:hypothetical protein